MNTPHLPVVGESNAKRPLAFLAVAMALTCALYLPHMGTTYVGLDFPPYERVFYSNDFVGTATQLFADVKGELIPGYYAPLSSITLMLDKWLVGSDLPVVHATLLINLLFHCVNGLLVFGLLRRLGTSEWVALGAASLFLLHPVQVPSILWFSQRKTVMSACLYLLSYLWYLRFRESEGRVAYVVALGTFVCAILAKPTAVVLPMMLLVSDLLGFPRSGEDARGNKSANVSSAPSGTGKSLPALAPFFLISLAFSLIAVQSEEVKIFDVPLRDRPFIAATAIFFYTAKIVAPLDLMYLYPRWHVDPSSLVWWLPLIGLGLVGCALAAVRGRIHPLVWWSLAAFLIPLATSIGFVKFGFQQHAFVANHFLYLSVVGAAGCVAFLIETLFLQVKQPVRYACALVALLYAFMLANQTWRQTAVWTDSLTLWTDNTARCPASYAAHDMLGAALIEGKRFEEAEKMFRKAIALDPSKWEGYNNLGAALWKQGKVEDAILAYRKGIAINPIYIEAYQNLGDAFSKLGRSDDAIANYRMAIRIKPDYAEAHSNLGDELLRIGKTDEAVLHFETAIRLKPYLPEPFINLGFAKIQAGEPSEALRFFQGAMRLNPRDAVSLNGMGIALASLGDLMQARDFFQRALTMAPDYDEARANLQAAEAQLLKKNPLP